MNMEIQETTAGVSLANGPDRRASCPGATSLDQPRRGSHDLSQRGGTDVGGYATLPRADEQRQNYLGFPGSWPRLRAVLGLGPIDDPDDDGGADRARTRAATAASASGHDRARCTSAPTTRTHLPNRDQPGRKVLAPGVLGFAAWKEALWAIDFAGRIHDAGNNPVNTVAPADLPLVGSTGTRCWEVTRAPCRARTSGRRPSRGCGAT